MTFPGTTWYVRIEVRSPWGSLSRVSTVPAGSLAKSSSVGANTVNGPSPLRVSTRPAAWRAAARVVKLPAATAVSTMSAVGIDSDGEGDGAAEVVIGAELAAAVSASLLPHAAVVSARASTAATGKMRRMGGVLSRRWSDTSSSAGRAPVDALPSTIFRQRSDRLPAPPLASGSDADPTLPLGPPLALGASVDDDGQPEAAATRSAVTTSTETRKARA